jgi:hypothetical protein
VLALCFPSGSIKCSQMPKGGLFTIIRQLVASFSSPGGSIKVFIEMPKGGFVIV